MTRESESITVDDQVTLSRDWIRALGELQVELLQTKKELRAATRVIKSALTLHTCKNHSICHFCDAVKNYITVVLPANKQM